MGVGGMDIGGMGMHNGLGLMQAGGEMPMQLGGAPLQINFAPKIITGGNDNSVGADPVNTGGSNMAGGGMITSNVPNIIMGGGSASDAIVPKANLENTGGSVSINDKDFNKGLFIVNKGGT